MVWRLAVYYGGQGVCVCLTSQVIQNFPSDILADEDLQRYSLVTEGVMFSGTGGMQILFNWRVRAARFAPASGSAPELLCGTPLHRAVSASTRPSA
jgi:hypothetical protein